MENFPKCIKWANNSVEHSWRRLPPACGSQALLGVRPRPWSTPRREPAPRSPRPTESRVRQCLSLLRTQRAPLCPAEACASNGTWPSPLLSVTCREGTRSSVLRHQRAHSGQLPCVGHWEKLTGYKGQKLTFLSFLHVDKCQNALFSLVTDPRMQQATAVQILLLVISNECHLPDKHTGKAALNSVCCLSFF